MRIEDGKGKGVYAGVNTEKRLLVDSVSQSVEHYQNATNGTSWNLVLSQTPTGANDFFFYYKNTDDQDYSFEGFYYRVASAEQVKIHLGRTGAPSGGTAMTAINLNTGSSKSPVATVEAGNDITGTSGGSVCEHVFMTSTETKNFNFEQDIILAPGGIIMFEAITGGVAINMSVAFNRIELT